MSDKDIYAHKAIASSMNFIELSSIIKSLSEEKNELSAHLKPEELEKYDILLSIYAEELEYLVCINNRNYYDLVH